MKFSWFLALRYLKPKRTFISIITVISVLGVALGVAVLLIVIAVMSGFEKRIKEEWLKVEPPLMLEDTSRQFFASSSPDSLDENAIPVWRSALTGILQHPGVTASSPYINVTSLMQFAAPKAADITSIDLTPPDPDAPATPEVIPPDNIPEPDAAPQGAPDPERPVTNGILVGIDPDDAVQMERLQNRFAESFPVGNFDLAGTSVVLPVEVLEQLLNGSTLQPEPGSSAINVFAPSYINEVVRYSEEQRAASGNAEKQKAADSRERTYPLPEELTLNGWFSDDKQKSLGFISLKTAQRLSGAGNAVDGLMVDIADPFLAGEMAESLSNAGLIPPGWRPVTWMERHRELFDAVANERGMMYIILGIISVVAAFCIMNTMITVAVQKRREIGMMRALGARTSHIVGVFVANGLVIAAMGVGLGYGLGITILAYRNAIRSFINDNFAWKIFDERIYGLREIPAELRPVDTVIICGLAFILCSLAAVPPALVVGRMAPARALRNDR